MSRIVGALLALFATVTRAELTMMSWPNGAAGGAAATSTVAALDNATLASYKPSDIFSVEIRGEFTPPAKLVSGGARLELSCEILNGNAFIWLDDHVICQGGHDPAAWGKYESDASVLPWEVASTRGDEAKPLFLRVTFAHPQPTAGPPSISLLWRPIGPPPPPPPPAPKPTLKYVGCYVDGGQKGKRDLPFNAGDLKSTDSPAACAAECAQMGSFGAQGPKYIGLQDGDNCFCGDTYGSQGKAKADSECNMDCPHGSKVKCGGPDRNSVYSTGWSGGPPPPPPGPPPAAVPAATFSADYSKNFEFQQKRLALQRGLLHGRWNTWAKGSVSAHTLLPHGVMLKLGICDQNGSCDENANKAMIDADKVRQGAHSYFHNYTQLYMMSRGNCNISVETSQLGGAAGADFVALLTPVSGCAGASAIGIMLMTDNNTAMSAAWRRFGKISTTRSTMTGTPDCNKHPCGVDAISVSADGKPFAGTQPKPDAADFLLLDLSQPAAFSTGQKRSVAQVSALIAKEKALEMATYAKYSEPGLADAAMMSQSGMMWNVQYSLEIPGTFAPVSRGWGNPWVIFDWDNIFGAYQFSLSARELAYSQLIAVIKTKTANGMVPNYWQPQGISYDRTEPVIGAKVLHETFKRWKEKWFVELLFDDCNDWIQWFFRRRTEPPLGLIALGSDKVWGTTNSPNMQAARYESGLDNSPMYDGEFFSFNQSTCKGSGRDEVCESGHMHLYDVGMSSMVAMELQALVNLSLSAFDPPRQDVHDKLLKQLTALKANIQKNLWNEKLGIFVNKWSHNADGSVNGSFYPRISPTSFYPMQARIATDAQATTMVEKWLTPKDKFCIAEDGDMAGNNRNCWWGLPSIQASDSAFPPLGYWRGFTWGPMVQLTYWALQQYPHVPAVVKGRKALAKQMTAMGLNQWYKHHHVCENYNPGFTAGNKGVDCTGDHFYHWGGLTGFVSLLEAGYYDANP